MTRFNRINIGKSPFSCIHTVEFSIEARGCGGQNVAGKILLSSKIHANNGNIERKKAICKTKELQFEVIQTLRQKSRNLFIEKNNSGQTGPKLLSMLSNIFSQTLFFIGMKKSFSLLLFAHPSYIKSIHIVICITMLDDAQEIA